jgi:hypothetical protein
MRHSRSLPGFAFDMAKRDMRRAKSRDPLITELVDALKRTTRTLETLCGLKGIDPSKSSAISEANAVLAKVEAAHG